MIKRPSKTTYRKAAMRMIPEGIARDAKRNQRVDYTRVPRGAWVEMWVRVPEEYALMEK